MRFDRFSLLMKFLIGASVKVLSKRRANLCSNLDMVLKTEFKNLDLGCLVAKAPVTDHHWSLTIQLAVEQRLFNPAFTRFSFFLLKSGATFASGGKC